VCGGGISTLGSIVTTLGGGVAGGKASAAAPNVAALEAAGDYAALVELLRCGDAKGKAAAANALQSLALNDADRVTIVKAGALVPLVEFLRNGGEAVWKRVAAWTARPQSASDDDARLQVAAAVEAGSVVELHSDTPVKKSFEENLACNDASPRQQSGSSDSSNTALYHTPEGTHTPHHTS
jgi:hypothetical protein